MYGKQAVEVTYLEKDRHARSPMTPAKCVKGGWRISRGAQIFGGFIDLVGLCIRTWNRP